MADQGNTKFRFVRLAQSSKQSIARNTKSFRSPSARKGSGSHRLRPRNCCRRARIPSFPTISPPVATATWQSSAIHRIKGLISLAADRPTARLPNNWTSCFPCFMVHSAKMERCRDYLEMANIPYVGCGVLASACGMDKVAMKLLFRQAGLPICKYVWFLRSQWQSDPARCDRRVAREIGFPCFVKPANLGSSVGVSKARTRAR